MQLLDNQQIEATVSQLASAILANKPEEAASKGLLLLASALQNLNSIAQSLEAIAMNVEQMNGGGAA